MLTWWGAFCRVHPFLNHDAKKESKQKKMNVRVDFTPMVDMLMLLITFFMLCTLHGWPVQCLLLNCWWNNGSLFLYFLLSSAFSSPLLYWTVLSSSFSGLTTLYPLSDNTPLSRSDHVLFPGFFCNYLFHGSLFGTLRLKSILVHLHTDCFDFSTIALNSGFSTSS